MVNFTKDKRKTWLIVAIAGSFGFQMVFFLLVFYLIGDYLDSYLGTEPWLLLISLLCGMAFAFFNYFIKLKNTGIIKDETVMKHGFTNDNEYKRK